MQIREKERQGLILNPLQKKILDFIFGSGAGNLRQYNSYQLARVIYFQGKPVSKKVIYSFRDKIKAALISIRRKIEKAFKLSEKKYQLLCSWEPYYKKLETIVPERSVEKMKEILDSLRKPLGRPGGRRSAIKTDVGFKYYQRFLLDLPPTSQKKWDELESLEFPGLDLVKRYFCLKGEKRIAMATLAEEKRIAFSKVSLTIDSILRYLNSGYRTSERAVQKAKTIERFLVPRLRREQKEKSERDRCSEYGEIPNGLNRKKWETFVFLKQLWVENPEKWQELQEKDPRVYRVLIERYNLDGTRPGALNLLKIGKEFGVKRQRIEQLEKRGVEFLLKKVDRERMRENSRS